MKQKLLLSAAPLALIATPVWAQSEGAVDPAPTTQDQVATDDTATKEIVVTGYRASLSSAQATKRNSDAIVDAVVAQDIGKLPDNTAAESLARVTGVQVSRYADEVSSVIVRGLTDVATTFNGRDVYTGDGRRVSLADFPSGSLAGLEVYKSSTANLIEPGIAGLINVRTFRPFDFKDGFTIAGSIRGTYNDQNKAKDPSGSLLLTGRTHTGIGDIGFLINASYTQSTYRNAARFAGNRDGTNVAPVPANVTVSPASVGRSFVLPSEVAAYNESGKRWRPSVNATLQWKPASNLEIYSDFLFQGYRNDRNNDVWNELLLDNGSTLSNVVLNDKGQVQSLTKTGGRRGQGFRSTLGTRNETYQYAVGAKWDTGRAHLSTDLAYTKTKRQEDEWSFDSQFNGPQRVDVEFFKDGGTAYSLPNFDRTNPASYLWRGYWNGDYGGKGSGWQWRADLDLDTDFSFLPTIQFGARWTDRKSETHFAGRYAEVETLGIPLGNTPAGKLELTQDTFRGSAQGFANWLAPARSGIAGNAAAIQQYAYQQMQEVIRRAEAANSSNPSLPGYREELAAFSTARPVIKPSDVSNAQESTYAFYGQGKYEFEIGSVRFDGLFGTRVVNTVGLYSGTGGAPVFANGQLQRDSFGNPIVRVQPISTRGNRVDILPIVSMRIRPNDQLQVRLAYTKTRTSPTFAQLGPATFTSNNAPRTNTDGSLVTTADDPRFAQNLQGRVDFSANGGNPNLKPITSKNYDATIEYYFSPTASISIAGFYRDLNGFISTYAQRYRDPVLGLVQVNQPLNAGAGKIKGVEVAGQTFFDFLPGFLSGFGVQGNVTYLQGKQRYPADLSPANAAPPFVKIPGLSKWSYNAALFYEKGDFSTRLSYNGRSNFLNGNNVVNGAYYGIATDAVTRLDFSFNYTPIEQVTLTLDATNLLAKPFTSSAFYAADKSYPSELRDEGRYIGVGARFRF